MNSLLPKKEELFPIIDDRKTYSDTPFNKNFDELDFQSRLQIVTDIVRQSILVEDNPNPFNEVEDMIGDSYTASKILIEYLNELCIGQNYRSVFARKRKFDIDDVTTKHIITLVDDEYGNTYQVDCSPYVGYKKGKVVAINEEKIYEDYVNVDGAIKDILEILREYIYKLKNGNLSEVEYSKFLNIIEDAKHYPILEGYVSYCLHSLHKLDSSDINLGFEGKEKLFKQIKVWREELDDLIVSDANYPRQMELAQAIIQELKLIDTSYERYANINGIMVPLSRISPRMFMEEGFNAVLIKPSSFKLGVSASVRDAFLKRGNGAIGEYYPNMGIPSEQLGLKKMRLFHPHGYKYERSMTGPGDMFLVRKDALKVLNIKRGIRNSLGKNLANKDVLWYDGDTINWNPIITNLVHSTDDPSEAAMHYVSNNPEHQLMTRFMYPNPVLRKERKK